jgi:hypothetical protein
MGWEIIKVYSNHFFHAVESTNFNNDSHNWDTEYVTEITNRPFLTDPNLNTPLA